MTRQRTKLDSVNQVADWLIVKNKDNPQFIANVKAKLTSIERPLAEISRVLTDKRTSLEASLLALQDQESITELYEDHVTKVEKVLRKQAPVSVIYEKLKKDGEEAKVI